MKRLVHLLLLVCLPLLSVLFLAGCQDSFLTGAASVEVTPVEEVFGGAETNGSEVKSSGIEDTSQESGAVGETEETDEAAGSGPETHTIEMNDEGFSTGELTIKAGDTIVWQNVRQGRMKGAMVIGMRECRDAKSGLFNPGESFSWTFKEAGICTIVDGIYTEEEMKIVVG